MASRPDAEALGGGARPPAEPVILIDGQNLLYRAYFALPRSIVDGDGRAVNAVVGFVSMLGRLISDWNPSRLAVALDSPWPTRRHAIYPAYKAGRSVVPPAEAVDQVGRLIDLLALLKVTQFQRSGYEADDIIATIVGSLSALGEAVPVLIVSTDRDLVQLVSNQVTLLRPLTGTTTFQLVRPDNVTERYGITADRYPEFAAITGDKSDNIPGVPGLGPKRAASLLATIPDIRSLLDSPHANGSKWERVLYGHRQLVSRNLLLTKLVADVPLDLDHLMSTAPLSFEKLSLSSLESLGLGTLASRLQQVNQQLRQRQGTEAPFAQPLFRRTVVLVSCGSRKSDKETIAANLYTSPLFRLTAAWASLIADRWFILSALHGLVEPERTLAPYDYSLQSASPDERSRWAAMVSQDLRPQVTADDRLLLFAGRAYATPVGQALLQQGITVVCPFAHLSIGRRLRWLKTRLAIGRHADYVDEFYELVGMLPRYRLGTATATTAAWPRSGVYFFFDPSEPQQSGTEARVVRVGTHGVSANSKSSLWGRLRTHRGLADGSGNHRSSVFRSHVGDALIARDRLLSEFPHWAERDASLTESRAERAMEAAVTSYLANLEVAVVDIGDAPSRDSDRAYLERCAIALLSTTGVQLHEPSPTWLGHYSPHPTIRAAGLWNVDHVGRALDPDPFLIVLRQYVHSTLGLRSAPNRSLAPPDWRTVKPNQLPLFSPGDHRA